MNWLEKNLNTEEYFQKGHLVLETLIDEWHGRRLADENRMDS